MNIFDRFNKAWTPEPFSGCWIWTRRISGRYGQIRMNKRHTPAHRVAWTLFKGEIHPGMWGFASLRYSNVRESFTSISRDTSG